MILNLPDLCNDIEVEIGPIIQRTFPERQAYKCEGEEAFPEIGSIVDIYYFFINSVTINY